MNEEDALHVVESLVTHLQDFSALVQEKFPDKAITQNEIIRLIIDLFKKEEEAEAAKLAFIEILSDPGGELERLV